MFQWISQSFNTPYCQASALQAITVVAVCMIPILLYWIFLFIVGRFFK